VPTNVVAVLRGFRYQVQNQPVNVTTEGNCYVQSDIFVNDLPVREYNGMKHGLYLRELFPAFIIVNELLDIRLTLSNDTATTTLDPSVDGVESPVLFEFYGNLILKTGVPVEFEVANAISGGQF
jgi:hypothetical protein